MSLILKLKSKISDFANLKLTHNWFIVNNSDELKALFFKWLISEVHSILMNSHILKKITFKLNFKTL
jgi:hypothetical protein